jgi:hypothetical protein
MTGAMLTCVALAKAARGCIRGQGSPESLGDERMAAPFAHRVVFADIEDCNGGLSRLVADGPESWLRQVMATGARDAWVVHGKAADGVVPERVAAAFANAGGSWGVHVRRDDGADVWIPRMRYAAAEDPGRSSWWWRTFAPAAAARASRPWQVTFTRLPLHGAAATAIPRADLAGCTSRLRTALAGNHEFARTWRLKPWDTVFGKALAALDDDSSSRPKATAIGPVGILEDAAERLLNAAAMAWCFGGMGTWNDIHVDDPVSQETQFGLASELYGAVVEAVKQATWPPGP